MNKLAHFIVNHKALIAIVVLILVIVSVVCLFFVNKNSDLVSYLDENTSTSQGKTALYEYFGIANEASLAIKTDNVDFLNEFVADVSRNAIVKNVMWIGNYSEIENLIKTNQSVADIIGESFKNIKNKFIKQGSDGKTIYFIGFYFDNVENKPLNKFINDVDAKLQKALSDNQIEEYCFGGSAVDSKIMLEGSLGEIPIYMIIAVVLLLVILLCTTKSWLEPFIFIITLGISLLLNMGTNIIFPSVSTITYSASSILQLALAMDYTIFLMHCYYDERKRSPLLEPKICMERALPKTLKTISASALTTVGGFIALFAMNFGIGVDLGRVLAKGVILSLLTVIFVQPIMILAVSKPLEKTKHKYLTPALTKTTKVSIKGRIPIIVLAIILIIPCFIGQLNVPLSYLKFNEPVDNPTDTQQVIAEGSNQILMVAPQSSNGKKNYEFLEEIEKLDGIENGLSFYSLIPERYYNLVTIMFPDLIKQLDGQLFSKGYTLYIFEVTSGIESKQTYANLDAIRNIALSIFGNQKVYITGTAQGAKDLAAVTPNDFMTVSFISALLIFVILLLTYRSPKMALILLLVIELGIWINLSIVTLLNIPINFMSYIVLSSVQLGATVDYAILAASKCSEAREEGIKGTKEIIVEGFRRATPSILVSATVLISICVSVCLITSNIVISQITLLIAAGAAMSTFLVLFLLPAVLYEFEVLHSWRLKRKLIKLGIVEESELNYTNLLGKKNSRIKNKKQ